jgi:hypothetical protein
LLGTALLACLLLTGGLVVHRIRHSPSSEEAGLFLWGFPLPWVATGPAHVGIGGSTNPLEAAGAFNHPRVLGVGLAFDALFCLVAGYFMVRVAYSASLDCGSIQ